MTPETLEQTAGGIEYRLGEVPADGIHRDVPDHIYHSWKLCSGTYLNLFHEKTPRHARAAMDGRAKEPSAAMRFGSMIHTAILEPEKFQAKYVESEYEKFQSNAAKAYRASLREQGIEPVNKEYMDAASDIALSVLTHDDAGKMLKHRTDTELSVIWTDKATGLRIKARIDVLIQRGGGLLVDLKTTANASLRPFQGTIQTLGYYRKMALYREGLFAHGIEVAGAAIIAVEGDEPYVPAVYTLSERSLIRGEDEVRELKKLFAGCQAAGKWPGYPTKEIDLPDWVYTKALPGKEE